MATVYMVRGENVCSGADFEDMVMLEDYKELEAENARLRQQLNSANSQIQILNRVIAGGIE